MGLPIGIIYLNISNRISVGRVSRQAIYRRRSASFLAGYVRGDLAFFLGWRLWSQPFVCHDGGSSFPLLAL